MHKKIEHRALVPIRRGNRLLAIAVSQLAVLRYIRKIVNRATTSIVTVLEEPNYALKNQIMLCY